MATDVPFWRGSTGAQARIESMVRFLESEDFEVRTFFLGEPGTDQFTQSDQERIAALGLDIEQKSSDQPPRGLARKMGWLAAATVHQLRNKPNHDGQSAAPESLTLDDFRWPWAIGRFSESVKQFNPDSILIQYIKLAYLLEGLRPATRRNIHCLIDTHDVLHRRDEQFRQRGFEHWINVTRDQEAAALCSFDTIVAIQDKEARLFREMVPEARVIVCGHATLSSAPQLAENAAASDQINIGYIGSLNASNTEALKSFLDEVWVDLNSTVSNSSPAQFKLIVAGEICEWIASRFSANELQNVTLMGKVDALNSFYDRIDVAINPVEFGTGLKIKNCEAIAFGKPLLTTPEGLRGMPAECQEACIAVESINDFTELLLLLLESNQHLTELAHAATKLSQTAFSVQKVYLPLKQSLLRAK